MFTRELAGDCVDITHPLHGDEKSLVIRQPGCVQLGDLIAKVVLELVDVVAVDGRRAGDERPPLSDLRLDAFHAHASTRAVMSVPAPGQTPFRARVTAAHCRWWSASAARPSAVIT